MGQTGGPSRAGLSLIELLVVLAVIGLLLALLVPAVQAARETANRMSCANHLHQIGVALLAHHDARRSFPVGCLEPKFKSPKGRQLGWSAFLLPFLEQQPLYDRIDFSQPFDSKANAQGAAEVLAVYLCPSSRRTSRWVQGRAAIDYGGIYGEAIPPNPKGWKPDNGTMLYDRPIRILEIVDGTSQTLVVSEDSEWKDGQWINGMNIFDQKYAINYEPANPLLKENEIRSRHPGGANGLFCDGSVRFLNQDMDLKTLEAICTRAGREVIAEF